MDSKEHNWGQSSSPEGMYRLFPRICHRCLIREDAPDADQPCDAVAERLSETEAL